MYRIYKLTSLYMLEKNENLIFEAIYENNFIHTT